MKFTSGKLAGMKAVSDNRGVIAAAAMDQRGSLQKALAKEKGGTVGDHPSHSDRRRKRPKGSFPVIEAPAAE